LAGDPIEHPGRDLNPTIGRDTGQATAKRRPAGLLDHLVNVNSSAGPRMPRVEHLALIDPVSVL
jgi:hypothetical protein